MRRSTIGAALFGIAVLALLGWLALRDPPEAAVEADAAGAAPVGGGARGGASGVASPPTHPEQARSEERSRGDDVAAEGDLSRREWLARAIELARRERMGGGGATAAPLAEGPPGSSDDVGHLDRDYIRERIRDIVPLIRECYELALEEQADLEGRLTVELVIAGEPEVGGIVEESRILDESTLVHPTLHECVRETVYTLELDPPENGGRVTVRYPFNFSPD